MKKLIITSFTFAVIAFGCRKIVEDGDVIIQPGTGPTPTGSTITLEGKIGSDTTLRAGNTYILKGLVYMVNNAKITIEPGTTIKGQFTDPVGGLVITRGAKIDARGTTDKPIVFTSNSSSPHSGDWAGIVILGKGKVNASYNGQQGLGEIEGGVNDAAGKDCTVERMMQTIQAHFSM